MRPDKLELKKRVHAGCGEHFKEQWWNIDSRGLYGIDQVCDATQPWFGLYDVEYVYAEHFVEHLMPGKMLDFLLAAREAMAPHGRIRLSTPGLEWVLLTHFDFSETSPEKVMLQTCRTNRAFHGWGHKFLWSQPTLVAALDACGFKQYQFFEYGVSQDPVLCNIETHGGYKVERGYPSVWIVEAIKDPSAILSDKALRSLFREQFGRHMLQG